MLGFGEVGDRLGCALEVEVPEIVLSPLAVGAVRGGDQERAERLDDAAEPWWDAYSVSLDAHAAARAAAEKAAAENAPDAAELMEKADALYDIMDAHRKAYHATSEPAEEAFRDALEADAVAKATQETHDAVRDAARIEEEVVGGIEDLFE